MGSSVVTSCGGCGSADLMPFFDMGRQPLAEARSGSARYPLALLRCGNCTLVQLSHAVDKAEVFPPDHPYMTSNSRVLREHYRDMVTHLERDLLVGDVVVDIGANDGTLLKSYTYPDKLTRIAVEPTGQVAKCFPGIVAYHDFFTKSVAEEIRAEYGPARIVTACNVLSHVPDPHDFLEGVKTLLGEDGEFITENHDLASITEGLQVDTIYHEHLRYYSVASLGLLLEKHGLRVISSRPTPMHGGSFRVRARRQREDFQSRAVGAAAALRGMLWKIAVADKQAIYGIGATTRATPLVHFAGIASFLACVCEVSGSEKIGQLIPGTQVPVVDECRLIEDQPPYALVLSWHIASDIMPKLRVAGYKGKFIIPLPNAEVVDA